VSSLGFPFSPSHLTKEKHHKKTTTTNNNNNHHHYHCNSNSNSKTSVNTVQSGHANSQKQCRPRMDSFAAPRAIAFNDPIAFSEMKRLLGLPGLDGIDDIRGAGGNFAQL